MKKIIYCLFVWIALSCGSRYDYDVVVIGGGASGVAAGLQAARSGAKTLLVEETPWLGGMLTSAGVSAVDGNYRLRGGIFGEFSDSVAAYYGGYDKIATGWVSRILFEPHVGDAIFKRMVAREKNLTVEYGKTFADVKELKYRILIDATELGDVAAELGVPFHIGMDAASRTGESIALENANDVVQDLTYVAILKDYGPDADMTIEKPEGYDRDLYVNCCINPLNTFVEIDPTTGTTVKSDTRQTLWTPSMMLSYGLLPVNAAGDTVRRPAKYMVNWPGDGNDCYVNLIEMTPEGRAAALDSAKRITLGFVYFIQTELGRRNLGLADDEHPTDDLLPFYPYHRESRRIEGEVLFVVDHAARPYDYTVYRTGIGVGDYPVDHHHYRNPAWMELPRLAFYPIPSFNVPLGVMIPKQVENLLVVEKSISVSNIMNGATRLQPVVMQIGQAAGQLAASAVEQNCPPREVKVRDVQKALLSEGCYLMPYLDLEVSDPHFAAVQRIGATGIMRGEGKNVNWSNETWFRAKDTVKTTEIFLEDYYPGKIPEELGLPKIDSENPMTRAEYAVAIDSILHPFESFDVDYHGKLIR
jgi:hypothetical protein